MDLRRAGAMSVSPALPSPPRKDVGAARSAAGSRGGLLRPAGRGRELGDAELLFFCFFNRFLGEGHPPLQIFLGTALQIFLGTGEGVVGR